MKYTKLISKESENISESLKLKSELALNMRLLLEFLNKNQSVVVRSKILSRLQWNMIEKKELGKMNTPVPLLPQFYRFRPSLYPNSLHIFYLDVFEKPK